MGRPFVNLVDVEEGVAGIIVDEGRDVTMEETELENDVDGNNVEDGEFEDVD
jgi:hypothetical protein